MRSARFRTIVAGEAVSTLGDGLPARFGLFVAAMTTAEGLAFAVAGLADDVALAAGLLAVLGVGVAYSTDVALPIFTHTHTPAAALGRVSSVMELPWVVLEPASPVLMGGVAAVSPRLVFVVAAAPLLLLAVGLAAAGRVRALRLDRRRP